MRISERIPLYEYMDIIDPSNKLSEIEKRGEKEDKYSWSILIEELKGKVIMNEYIYDFIEKIKKNISFSDIYYNTVNKHIDSFMEEINEENSNFLFELRRYILLFSIDDPNFYLYQKGKLNKELDIINKINIKIKNDKKNNNLENLKIRFIKLFEKRKEIINLINKKTIFYNNEDNLIINIKNDEDIEKAVDFIKNNTIIYKNVKLPRNIKIKEKPKNTLMILTINLNKNKDYHFIYKYLKYKNDKKNTKLINNSNIYKCNIIKNNKLNKNKVFNKNNNNNIIKMYSYTININIRFQIIIIRNYKYFHYFDKWRKKHITM